MSDAPPEITLFMVNNGGEYSDYAVTGLFTDKTLAEEYARASNGVVQEWPANVPRTKWVTHTGRLYAQKKNGRWDVKINVYQSTPSTHKETTTADLGSDYKWGKLDPKLKTYTHGYANAGGQSKEQVKKICIDAFWKKVSELEGDPQSPVDISDA